MKRRGERKYECGMNEKGDSGGQETQKSLVNLIVKEVGVENINPWTD